MGRDEDQTCRFCGRPTRFSVNDVYQCFGGCPTVVQAIGLALDPDGQPKELAPPAPVPVAEAIEAAQSLEFAADEE